MDIKAHLTQLSELHGPSGYESAVRAALQTAWTPLVDSLEVGSLGSLVGLKRGSGSEPRRRIMLCAHMDEIGLIVHDFAGDGFLHVTDMGGIDTRTLPGMPVIVHGRQMLRGVVGVPALHTLSEADRAHYPGMDALVIDLGLPEAEVRALVSVGDVITMDAPVLDLGGTRLAGKAMDDRACVAAVTACLELLGTRRHLWDVLAVASTQEEVGSFGALTEAYRLNPDIAIALDVTFGTQPGVSEGHYKLGTTPIVSLGANFHPALFEAIVTTAERLDMTLQPDPLPMSSGTDAWEIQTSRDGIPSALINIPIRHMHSTVELVDTVDITRTARLLAEFIAGLEADFLSTITWDKSA